MKIFDQTVLLTKGSYSTGSILNIKKTRVLKEKNKTRVNKQQNGKIFALNLWLKIGAAKKHETKKLSSKLQILLQKVQVLSSRFTI
jgi:hypothetical protein